MRVHSAVSYAETKLFVCALCRSCFHTVELFEMHKSSKHPNYEQDMDALSKYYSKHQYTVEINKAMSSHSKVKEN